MMFNKVYLGATPISKIFLGDVPIKYGNNIVAIYTVNDINKTSPTLVVGKANEWKETIKDNGDGTYKVTITASYGPTKISFENNTSLLSVDYLDVSNITDTSDMFHGCTNLQILHLDDWSYDSISMIINASSLPINDIGTIKSIHCKKEEADGLIAPENWEFSYPYNTIAIYTVKDKQRTSPTYVAGKADDWEETVKNNGDGTYTVTITASYGPTYIDFDVYSGITLLTVDYLDTSNINSMSYMFYGCHDLTSINVRNWNTSQVTDMSYMFYDCWDLTSIDLSKFDTSKVTDMNHMFQGCDNLTSLDLSNWDTSKVTNMESMFGWCSLTSLDLSNWDTSKVTNMDHMFSWSNITSLDLSNFDMTNVTDMEAMFYNCNNLTSLDLSNWSTFSAYESYMFTNCNKLESLYLTNCNFSTVNRIINMKDFPKNKIDGVIRTIHWNNDNWKNEITLIPPPTNWMYSFMLHNLVAIYTVNDSSKTSPDLVEGKADDWGEAVIDNGNGTYKVIVTASSGPTRIKFNNSSTINNTTLLSVDYIDTSNMTSMNSMFSKCIRLTSVNASNFDTDQVTDMEHMFSNCKSLTSLDLSSFDTSNVKNMRIMFSGCDSLTSLNVSNFDTSNVTDMYWMFASTSLTSLNLSSFDTSNVKNMNSMFYNCKSLTTLNLSNFDTNNVTNINWMFDGCTSLQELRLDNCNNSNISEIITSTNFPTNVISGATKTIYCKEEAAAGLTVPTNWEFSYVL